MAEPVQQDGAQREAPLVAPSEHTDRRSMAQDISDAIVGLYKRYYGRGPTKARTHLTHDTVMCVLEEIFTTVERSLVERGDHDTVAHVRRSFQRRFEGEFVSSVEEITRRKVRAFLSESHTDPDLAVEVFLLEPDSSSPRGEHDAASR
jgi:uncharacterized protein YbcI